MSPFTSSDLPEPDAGHTNGFLFGLAPSGVYHRHRLLPAARCALTAPFHPYRHPDGCLGGFLSAALSVGSRLPGVTWRSTLWSPDFPPRNTNLHCLRTHQLIAERLPSRLRAATVATRLAKRKTQMPKFAAPCGLTKNNSSRSIP